MKKGFTLIETMVAVTIFVIVAMIIAGVTLSIVESLRRALAMKSVIDNLGFAMENMTLELREGKNYQVTAGGDKLSFTNAEGNTISFKRETDAGNRSRIVRCGATGTECLTGSGVYVPVTSSSVDILALDFELTKALAAGRYPVILNDSRLISYGKDYVKISVYAKGLVGQKKQTDFRLQTTASQRNI